MSAKVIHLATVRRRGKKPKARPSSTVANASDLRVWKADGHVMLTVGDLECTLTPAEAAELGEYFTLMAIGLGAKP